MQVNAHFRQNQLEHEVFGLRRYNVVRNLKFLRFEITTKYGSIINFLRPP